MSYGEAMMISMGQHVDDEVVEQIRKRYQMLRPALDERQVRLWVAAEAEALGHGGMAAVTRATGILHKRILAGRRDVRSGAHLAASEAGAKHPRRIRRPGAGRKKLTEKDPTLLKDLESLVAPETRGDPQSPLRWTCKSVRRLSVELGSMGHQVSWVKVAKLLKELGYSLQGTRKTREGTNHPDRNAQFEHINGQAKAFQKRGQPVISVDTKKKELVGDFSNKGREWQPSGQPEEVRVHDFIDEKLGKAIPYGVYDVGRNEGWVSVGIDHDTSEFAVETIKQWWRRMGARAYPAARELLITADGGGSNGHRTRLWKLALQGLADSTGLTMTVCHYPPGTSKWNKIEHRLFSHITANWRGRPLESVETVVNLIGNTSTAAGLRVRAAKDAHRYGTAKQVSQDELRSICLARAHFHGDWNYTISPRAGFA